jgi:acetyltransferase-like isoleucine patch superfamily enzyme
MTEKMGNLSHKESTTNNSSFVETFLKDLTKQILSSNSFIDMFTKQVQEQPLSIYKWTNDQNLPTLGQLREKYINSLKLLVISQIGDLSSERGSKRGKSVVDSRMTHSRLTYRLNSSSTKDVVKDYNKGEEFNEAMDNQIQEKYLKDLLAKYKYTIKEINEKIILINEETKKLVSDTIMENTIYNLISQTVYGEIDLTIKPRIYFFLGKGNNFSVNESANLGSVQGSVEIKNNNLLKSENNINKNSHEDDKIEEKEQNSKVNSARKEENKSNNSIISKNSKKSSIKNN